MNPQDFTEEELLSVGLYPPTKVEFSAEDLRSVGLTDKPGEPIATQRVSIKGEPVQGAYEQLYNLTPSLSRDVSTQKLVPIAARETSQTVKDNLKLLLQQSKLDINKEALANVEETVKTLYPPERVRTAEDVKAMEAERKKLLPIARKKVVEKYVEGLEASEQYLERGGLFTISEALLSEEQKANLWKGYKRTPEQAQYEFIRQAESPKRRRQRALLWASTANDPNIQPQELVDTVYEDMDPSTRWVALAKDQEALEKIQNEVLRGPPTRKPVGFWETAWRWANAIPTATQTAIATRLQQKRKEREAVGEQKSPLGEDESSLGMNVFDWFPQSGKELQEIVDWSKLAAVAGVEGAEGIPQLSKELSAVRERYWQSAKHPAAEEFRETYGREPPDIDKNIPADLHGENWQQHVLDRHEFRKLISQNYEKQVGEDYDVFIEHPWTLELGIGLADPTPGMAVKGAKQILKAVAKPIAVGARELAGTKLAEGIAESKPMEYLGEAAKNTQRILAKVEAYPGQKRARVKASVMSLDPQLTRVAEQLDNAANMTEVADPIAFTRAQSAVNNVAKDLKTLNKLKLNPKEKRTLFELRRLVFDSHKIAQQSGDLTPLINASNLLRRHTSGNPRLKTAWEASERMANELWDWKVQAGMGKVWTKEGELASIPKRPGYTPHSLGSDAQVGGVPYIQESMLDRIKKYKAQVPSSWRTLPKVEERGKSVAGTIEGRLSSDFSRSDQRIPIRDVEAQFRSSLEEMAIRTKRMHQLKGSAEAYYTSGLVKIHTPATKDKVLQQLEADKILGDLKKSTSMDWVTLESTSEDSLGAIVKKALSAPGQVTLTDRVFVPKYLADMLESLRPMVRDEDSALFVRGLLREATAFPGFFMRMFRMNTTVLNPRWHLAQLQDILSQEYLGGGNTITSPLRNLTAASALAMWGMLQGTKLGNPIAKQLGKLPIALGPDSSLSLVTQLVRDPTALGKKISTVEEVGKLMSHYRLLNQFDELQAYSLVDPTKFESLNVLWDKVLQYTGPGTLARFWNNFQAAQVFPRFLRDFTQEGAARAYVKTSDTVGNLRRISEIEKKTLNNAFSFYGFMRFVYPFMVRSLVQRPDRWLKAARFHEGIYKGQAPDPQRIQDAIDKLGGEEYVASRARELGVPYKPTTPTFMPGVGPETPTRFITSFPASQKIQKTQQEVFPELSQLEAVVQRMEDPILIATDLGLLGFIAKNGYVPPVQELATKLGPYAYSILEWWSGQDPATGQKSTRSWLPDLTNDQGEVDWTLVNRFGETHIGQILSAPIRGPSTAYNTIMDLYDQEGQPEQSIDLKLRLMAHNYSAGLYNPIVRVLFNKPGMALGTPGMFGYTYSPIRELLEKQKQLEDMMQGVKNVVKEPIVEPESEKEEEGDE